MRHWGAKHKPQTTSSLRAEPTMKMSNANSTSPQRVSLKSPLILPSRQARVLAQNHTTMLYLRTAMRDISCRSMPSCQTLKLRFQSREYRPLKSRMLRLRLLLPRKMPLTSNYSRLFFPQARARLLLDLLSRSCTREERNLSLIRLLLEMI